MVTDYFGPDGLGYLPETPGELGNWSGGSAQDINNAINSGAFLLQHRDHGYEDGWGEPDYNSGDISGLDNDDLTFVYSINCLTGKFNISGQCFVEVFHRYPKGALGCIAPTEVSYSFVNDTYVWGSYDNLWPDFMPDYETPPEPRGLYPSFGNVAGKYFLEQSNWPYNTSNKEVTYYLFHHHGGSFSELYSEVPQNLTVLHDGILLAGLDYFSVTADEGSLIALTVGEEIIGVAEGTGQSIDIPITPQYPPTYVTLTVTKTNHYRYMEQIQVIPPNGPYVVKDAFTFEDENGNGQVDNGEEIIFTVTMKNVGNEDASDVDVTMSSEDAYVTITDNTENYGDIPSQDAVTVENAFTADFANDIPDGHMVVFSLTADDGSNTWNSSISVTGHSPSLAYVDFVLDDASGNGNGRLDPGETAQITITVDNDGSAPAYEVNGSIASTDEYVEILSNNQTFGEIAPEGTAQQTFEIYALPTTPTGHEAEFTFDAEAVSGHTAEGSFSIVIGQIPILVLDLDPNQSSGSDMIDIINDIGITASYETSAISDYLQYNTIFVCLGVYSSNHVLASDEGAALREFLLAGGNLYMEGADTWYYDDPTSVHSFFKINGISDGSGDLGVIKGINGSFTDGLIFNYAGENSYIDHIAPLGDAFMILENQSPNYGTTVAYDGGTYKTIGASFEFGGLTDGNNTKEELMDKYLQFFGFTGPPEQPPGPVGISTVCAGEENVEYSTEGVSNADYYVWTLEPEEAGMVFGSGKVINIHWDATFSGTAVVKVCGMNGMGAGPESDGLEVSISEAPTALLTGTQDICQGESAMLSVELTGTSPWNVRLGDGSWVEVIDSPWNEMVTPEISMEYTIDSVNDASGCSNIGEGVAMVTVNENPEFVLGNDTSICINYEITLEAPPGYASYLWSDNTTGMSMTIDSTGVGLGDKTVSLTVSDENACEGIAYCTITFTECAGIAEIIPGLDVNVYPVPARDMLHIELTSDQYKELNIQMTDAYGKLIYQEKGLVINDVLRKKISLSNFEKGVYFLIFENESGILNKKIIVN
ncbi:MAG: C25 family cysteine peptidase [Bacteroidota bacterium]|nr:C25 family cysteine peptidase [Bacteroidota bacterium]